MPESTRRDWTSRPLPKSSVTYHTQDGELVVVDLRPMLGVVTEARIMEVLTLRLGSRLESVDHAARTVTLR